MYFLEILFEYNFVNRFSDFLVDCIETYNGYVSSSTVYINLSSE